LQAAAAKHAGHARGDGPRPGAGCALTGHPAPFRCERAAGWYMGVILAGHRHDGGGEHRPRPDGVAPGAWPAVALAGSYELLMVIIGAARLPEPAALAGGPGACRMPIR
jgi:hypothetical protein